MRLTKEAIVTNPSPEGMPTRSVVQSALFDWDSEPIPSDVGFRGPVACSAAGITYRQLDYWARTELVTPTVRSAEGSGSQRLYSFRDILMLKVVKSLLDAGISLQQIRQAVQHLQDRGLEDISGMTLMSDGVSVYECTSEHEVYDLLRGGQGMFAIALDGAVREVEGELVKLPSISVSEEHTSDETIEGDDEFSRARRRRRAA